MTFSGDWRLPTLDEFYHLWSVELQNPPGLFNSGPFVNLELEVYWTGTELFPGSSSAFHMQFGFANAVPNSLPVGYGMAVRDVDPGSQVPVPSSLALLALGILGLAGFNRQINWRRGGRSPGPHPSPWLYQTPGTNNVGHRYFCKLF